MSVGIIPFFDGNVKELNLAAAAGSGLFLLCGSIRLSKAAIREFCFSRICRISFASRTAPSIFAMASDNSDW